MHDLKLTALYICTLNGMEGTYNNVISKMEISITQSSRRRFGSVFFTRVGLSGFACVVVGCLGIWGVSLFLTHIRSCTHHIHFLCEIPSLGQVFLPQRFYRLRTGRTGDHIFTPVEPAVLPGLFRWSLAKLAVILFAPSIPTPVVPVSIHR